MSQKILVIGSGFNALATTYLLKKQGYDLKILFDRSIKGVLGSVEVEGVAPGKDQNQLVAPPTERSVNWTSNGPHPEFISEVKAAAGAFPELVVTSTKKVVEWEPHPFAAVNTTS